MEQQESRKIQNFKSSKNYAGKKLVQSKLELSIYFDAASMCLKGVLKTAGRSLREFRKICGSKKKTAQLKPQFSFSKTYGRNLKQLKRDQSLRFSPIRLQIFSNFYDGFTKKLSKVFYLTASQSRKKAMEPFWYFRKFLVYSAGILLNHTRDITKKYQKLSMSKKFFVMEPF